jgi:hypothetical protein
MLKSASTFKTGPEFDALGMIIEMNIYIEIPTEQFVISPIGDRITPAAIDLSFPQAVGQAKRVGPAER